MQQEQKSRKGDGTRVQRRRKKIINIDFPTGRDDLEAIRLATKAELLATEGPLCQQCGVALATDMHEIISRARCRGSVEAFTTVCRHVELCILLCQDCHIMSSVETDLLTNKKIARYGTMRLRLAIVDVNEHLRKGISLGDLLDERSF